MSCVNFFLSAENDPDLDLKAENDQQEIDMALPGRLITPDCRTTAGQPVKRRNGDHGWRQKKVGPTSGNGSAADDDRQSNSPPLAILWRRSHQLQHIVPVPSRRSYHGKER